MVEFDRSILIYYLDNGKQIITRRNINLMEEYKKEIDFLKNNNEIRSEYKGNDGKGIVSLKDNFFWYKRPENMYFDMETLTNADLRNMPEAWEFDEKTGELKENRRVFFMKDIMIKKLARARAMKEQIDKICDMSEKEDKQYRKNSEWEDFKEFITFGIYKGNREKEKDEWQR